MKKWGQRLITLLCILFVAAFVPVRSEHGYFCDYTGSFKTWTTWFLLFESDYHYQKSKMEELLETGHSSDLEHKWVSFCGTTTFLFAGKMFAHGQPGPFFRVPQTMRDEWCDAVSSDEKLQLYELLRRGDKKAIQRRVGEIEEFILRQLSLPMR